MENDIVLPSLVKVKNSQPGSDKSNIWVTGRSFHFAVSTRHPDRTHTQKCRLSGQGVLGFSKACLSLAYKDGSKLAQLFSNSDLLKQKRERNHCK